MRQGGEEGGVVPRELGATLESQLSCPPLRTSRSNRQSVKVNYRSEKTSSERRKKLSCMQSDFQMGDDICMGGGRDLKHTVILLRHGESQWNSDNRCETFPFILDSVPFR